MLKAPYSSEHVEAIETVVSALQSAGVWYRATGGLAGNLHGSVWPLHDIDLDYLARDWNTIAEVLSRYLVEGPIQYEDDEFRLVMARARISSVEIELCQLEDCFVAGATGWQRLDANPDRREARPWKSRKIWATPLDDLIAYKEIIGRESDLRDLRNLRPFRHGE